MPKKIPKKYYWLRLKKDFFTDPKIKKLRRIAGGDTYTIILLKIMLLTLNTDGILIYEGIEKNLSDELALILDEDEKNVEATLIFMETMKLLVQVSTNEYELPIMQDLIGSETDSAERKRRQREREKVLENTKNVTLSHQSHAQVTSCHKNVPTEKEKEIEKELEKEPLSKSLSIKNQENYHDFRERIRRTYQNKTVLKGSIKVTDTLIYTDKVTISVNSVGHLYNDYIMEELTYEAKPLWRWMYEHQDRLEPIT